MVDARHRTVAADEAIRQLERHATAFERLAARLQEGGTKADLLWLVESQRDWVLRLSSGHHAAERIPVPETSEFKARAEEHVAALAGTSRGLFKGAVTMSVADTAAALGLGRTKLYQLISDGTLVRLKIGSRTLITVESIRALVAANSS